jgi:TolB-like protein
MKKVVLSGLCKIVFILLIVGLDCYSQDSKRQILIFPHQESISTDFKSSRFRDELKTLDEDFARALERSKATGFKVTLDPSKILSADLARGFGKDNEIDRDSIFLNKPNINAFIVWRVVSEDQFIRIRGELYDKMEQKSFYLKGDGSQQIVDRMDSIYHIKTTFSEYLLDQLVEQIEAYYDSKIRVFITPFVQSGNDSLINYIGETIADRIQSRLSQSEHIRVIRGTTVQPESLGISSISRRQMREWTIPEQGKREAAKYLVAGKFSKVGNVISITAEDIDLETSHSVISQSIIVDTLEGLALFKKADQLGDRLRSGIELDYTLIDDTLKTVGIVASVPYPASGFNIAIAKNVARGIRDVLSFNKDTSRRFKICYEPQKIDKFIDGEVDVVDQSRELMAHYLLSVGIDRPLPDFVLNLSLLDFRYPSNPIYKQSFQVEDIDNLYGHIGKYTNEFLEKCWAKTKCKYRSPSTDVKSQMEGYRIKDETWGIRGRGMIIGLLKNSMKVYLDNLYRYGMELSLIHYSIPMQYELSFCYDFGQTVGDHHVYGRYLSLSARRNMIEWNLIRDMRLYGSCGIAGINVVRVKPGSINASLVLGLTFGIGVDYLTLRKMYLDMNCGILMPFKDVNGFSYPGNNESGGITSISISLGVGYRF